MATIPSETKLWIVVKDDNGQGIGKVEQNHTHTRIVDGYKIISVPVLTGMKFYPYLYPAGTRTH
jgi:hypothetical protein